MSKKQRLTTDQERLLGMDREITRRDFLNAALVGAGAVLLDFPSPKNLFAQDRWDGFGGTGDYASSHGNMDANKLVAHICLGSDHELPSGIQDTGEIFDLVVVGGGISGLGAANDFRKHSKRDAKCLVIENHEIFGGQAKRNEFEVEGTRLIGPQGSNGFVVLGNQRIQGYDIYSELGLPKHFEYQAKSPDISSMQFDRTNFGFMLWYDSPNIGYFFDHNKAEVKPRWIHELLDKNLNNAPIPENLKKDLNTWRTSTKQYYNRGDYERWLDTITYKEYIEKVMGLGPAVTGFADPVLAATVGLGCDVISAYAAYQIGMPGFKNHLGWKKLSESQWHSFPGGNDGIARHLVKLLIPKAIKRGNSFEDIMNQKVRFEMLDLPENKVRLRLGAIVVRVKHEADPDKSRFAWVYYRIGEEVFRIKARSVVMASGNWVAGKIITDLNSEYREAFTHFYRSPMLVVNVALKNWQFLKKLGLTACRWFNGFGFSCNIRQSMVIGDYNPPLDPAKPVILTFYVPFYYPGESISKQGSMGREKLLSESYYDVEVQIRRQMVTLFASAGFDPGRDIAGIILNRWGHAYVNPQPGFYFDKAGIPAPRDILRKRFGRIAFANAELNGHQNWVSAVEEGIRAARQAMEII